MNVIANTSISYSVILGTDWSLFPLFVICFVGGTSPTGSIPAGSPLNGNGVSLVRDSPMLLQQIDNLKSALAHVKRENRRVVAEKMKVSKTMDSQCCQANS